MLDGFTLYEIIEEATGLLWDDQAKSLQDMTAQLQAAAAKSATALKDAQKQHAKELHAEILKRQRAERKRTTAPTHGPNRRPYNSLAQSTKGSRWREVDDLLARWRSIAGATCEADRDAVGVWWGSGGGMRAADGCRMPAQLMRDHSPPCWWKALRTNSVGGEGMARQRLADWGTALRCLGS